MQVSSIAVVVLCCALASGCAWVPLPLRPGGIVARCYHMADGTTRVVFAWYTTTPPEQWPRSFSVTTECTVTFAE